MTIHRFLITRKVRQYPVFPASLHDFEYEAGETVDATVLLEDPLISLFSFDHATRRAVFVQTPASVDLAQAPFYYQWQYEHATHLLVAPYEALFTLVRPLRERGERLILIYSIGRCGSTLLSHAFNRVPGVVSLSEPDVFTLLAGLRDRTGAFDPEVSELVRTFTLLLCKPTLATPAPSHWALKFRAACIELGDLLYMHFPQAKTLFIYRNAESWARSSIAAFRLLDPEMAPLVSMVEQFIPQMMPSMNSYLAGDTVEFSPGKFLGAMWLVLMQRYLELYEHGLPLCALRYEDLKAAPADMLNSVLTYCDLPTLHLPEVLGAMDEDSQRGTLLAQEQARQNPYLMTEQQLTEMRLLLRKHPLLQTPDFVVPNTLARP